MWKTTIISGLVGGIIAFVWSVLSWTVIPWHQVNFHRFTDESDVAKTLMKNAPRDGLYVISPMMDGTKSMKDHDGHGGPLVFSSINRQGVMDHHQGQFVVAILTQIVGACFISWLLLNAKNMKYWDRVTFVTVVGLVVGLLSYLPTWNWWGYPLSFTVVGILDHVITWFLAGLGIAYFVKKH